MYKVAAQEALVRFLMTKEAVGGLPGNRVPTPAQLNRWNTRPAKSGPMPAPANPTPAAAPAAAPATAPVYSPPQTSATAPQTQSYWGQ